MRVYVIAMPLLAVYYANASPLTKRQDESAVTPSSVAETPSTISDPAGAPSSFASPIDSVSSPIQDPPSSPSPPGSSPSPAPVTPSPEDDCPPCEDEKYWPVKSPSGRVCYCLGGGQKGQNNGDKEPWSWAGPLCHRGDDGIDFEVTEDERPQVCRSDGATPGSRECLNQCNYMATTVQSANPCNPNVVNAAKGCGECFSDFYVQVGKDAHGIWIVDGPQVVAKLIDGLQTWCAKPDRCYDLEGGEKISGQGGCPILAVNKPASPPPSVVTTNTRSFTDLNGRPTFAIELLTVEDPNFTANSEFAGARPTGASGTGAGMSRHSRAVDIAFVSVLLFLGVLI